MSEITTDNAILKGLLQGIDCGRKCSVSFKSIDEIQDFVKAVKDAFKEEDFEEKPSNTYFIAETEEYPTQKSQSLSYIVHYLPAKVFFNNQNEIIRFAAACSERTDLFEQKRIDDEEKRKDSLNTANNEAFATNHTAEVVLDNVANGVLIFGWVLGIIHILAGLILTIMEEQPLGIVLGGVMGAIYIFACRMIWATLKVVVNMSNNLYNINQQLKK